MINIPDNILPRDAQGQSLCPKCRKLAAKCVCPSSERPPTQRHTLMPIIKLDKKGRNGKIVTLITNLPSNENHLKKLAKRLKSETGSGGTFYIQNESGTIEIQGNHINRIKI